MELLGVKAAVERLFDGRCRIFELECGQEGAMSYAESWRQKLEAPCHLQIIQAEPAAGRDGARPQARGRLFLPAELGAALQPGSRVEVWQQGQHYLLGDCGLAVCWPTHCQVELELLA